LVATSHERQRFLTSRMPWSFRTAIASWPEMKRLCRLDASRPKSGAKRDDCIVQTEYGADFWCEIFQAGFQQVTLTSLIFPASVAIYAIKK